MFSRQISYPTPLLEGQRSSLGILAARVRTVFAFAAFFTLTASIAQASSGPASTTAFLTVNGTQPAGMVCNMIGQRPGLPALTGSVMFTDVTANQTLGTAPLIAAGNINVFGQPFSYPAGTGPSSIATGDFNGDGIPDLAVANFQPAGAISILLGNGDGSFQAPVAFSTGAIVSEAIVAADFNGDGKLDLALAEMLVGNGDGTFQVQVVTQLVEAGQAMATADFNKDVHCGGGSSTSSFGGGNPGTPAGNYTVTLNAAGGSQGPSHSLSLSLAVK